MKPSLLLSSLLIALLTLNCTAQNRGKNKIFTPCKYVNNATEITVKCVIHNLGDSISLATFNVNNNTEINPHFRLKFKKQQVRGQITGLCIYPAKVPFTINFGKQTKTNPVFNVTSDQHGISEVVVNNLIY